MTKEIELFIHQAKRAESLIERTDVTTTTNDRYSCDCYHYTDEVLEQLQTMNQKYSVGLYAGGYEILREVRNNRTKYPSIQLMWKTAFHDHHSNQRVEVQARKNGKKVTLPLSKVWLDWSGRRVSVLQCRGMRPFYAEGRTIDGDSRYFDESTYECAGKPMIGARCVGCHHGIRIKRVIRCKYFQVSDSRHDRVVSATCM